MNTPTFKEQEQIKLAQKDIRHFGPLYDLYYVSVFRFIYNRIEVKDDAQDICSGVFIKAMDKISSYQDRGYTLKSWLIRISINEINLFYRSRKTHQKFFIEQKHLSSLTEEVDEQIGKEELLKEYLEEMSKDDFDLIQMKYFEGMSFHDIAQVLDKSEESLRVYMHRLRKRMKTQLIKISKKKGIELVMALSVLIITLL